jgi:hypothetical protein
VYGFYSPSLDKWSGHALYLNKDGQYVAITQVVDELEKASKYHREDEIYVGEVTQFVRRNEGEIVTNYKFINGMMCAGITEYSIEPQPDDIVLAKGET